MPRFSSHVLCTIAFLVTLMTCSSALSFSSSGIMRPTAADFARWMAQGGYPITGTEKLPELRSKLIMRAQKQAVGELISQKRMPFDTQGKKITSKDYPYFAWIPPYAASIIPGQPAVTWTAPCFKSNTGIATANPDGTYTINLTLSEPTSLFCSDNYLVATTEGLKFESYFFHGTQVITWTVASNINNAELWDIKTNGFRVFVFLDDLLQTLDDLLATLLLFGSELSQGVPDWVAAYNLDFLSKYTGINLVERNVTSVSIDESLISSGDFFGILRLDGLDPMLAWAMGSTTGHTTLALRIDGELYIIESTVKDSYWPTNGIQKTPYQQWITQARAAGYAVVHSPLSAKYRAMFNETSAFQQFLSWEGFDYGYHNLLYGWIDTLKDNYPCLPPDYTQCLSFPHLEILMSILERLVPSFADLLFLQAFNLRLGTSGLKTAELLFAAAQQGIPADSIPAIVEKDTFVYNTTRYNNSAAGPSMVCCVFVCNMWKAGGLFNEINNELNCAELTNWDDYVLTLFDTTTPRPPQCVAADPDNNLCQLEGKYSLHLNNYASKNMYAHMAEHCPSLPPKYIKPPNC